MLKSLLEYLGLQPRTHITKKKEDFHRLIKLAQCFLASEPELQYIAARELSVSSCPVLDQLLALRAMRTLRTLIETRLEKLKNRWTDVIDSTEFIERCCLHYLQGQQEILERVCTWLQEEMDLICSTVSVCSERYAFTREWCSGEIGLDVRHAMALFLSGKLG